MGCILLVPEWIYTDYLFSAEFKGIRKVIGGLSIGIVALGCNSIISHYFIGSGKIGTVRQSSCVGLIALLISGFLLIPSYGVVGSAITTSIAFTSMLVFSLTVFSGKHLHAGMSSFRTKRLPSLQNSYTKILVILSRILSITPSSSRKGDNYA